MDRSTFIRSREATRMRRYTAAVRILHRSDYGWGLDRLRRRCDRTDGVFVMSNARRPLDAQSHPRPYMIQWERTLRWRSRAAESISKGDDQEAFDFLFALFASIFHMRDWIVASRGDLRRDLGVLFRTSDDLAIVRDLANGSKHMETTRYSIDGAATVAREYAGGGEYRFVVPRPGGRNLDCLGLADRCIHELQEFMNTQGLLTSR
jgi:hypothetical protein